MFEKRMTAAYVARELGVKRQTVSMQLGKSIWSKSQLMTYSQILSYDLVKALEGVPENAKVQEDSVNYGARHNGDREIIITLSPTGEVKSMRSGQADEMMMERFREIEMRLQKLTSAIYETRDNAPKPA
jgi:hypothetical protein